ncbi:MAG: tetratricopeptide repeat protein [Patescibacteria group bacterium]|jgi:tetratricopeptide (TPR) repeat protein
MVLTIILISVFVLSVGVLGVLLVRKAPSVLVIDPSASKDAKAKELKRDILKKRLERATAVPISSARDVLVAPFVFMQRAVRSVAGQLKALEDSYAKLQKGGKPVNEDAVRQLFEESEAAFRAGRTDDAEKRLIELISLNPKYAEAYELLGRVYMQTKDYALARETLLHVLKLSPKNASVYASLGEVSELEGKVEAAYEAYKRAMELSPNNPKYLDFFISAAITADNFEEAKEALERLKEVNPQNQKIAEFSAILLK